MKKKRLMCSETSYGESFACLSSRSAINVATSVDCVLVRGEARSECYMLWVGELTPTVFTIHAWSVSGSGSYTIQHPCTQYKEPIHPQRSESELTKRVYKWNQTDHWFHFV